MGQAKHHKKERKIIRKTVHAELGTGIESLFTIVRPRPKWIPKMAWLIIAWWPLMRSKHLGIVYRHMK